MNHYVYIEAAPGKPTITEHFDGEREAVLTFAEQHANRLGARDLQTDEVFSLYEKNTGEVLLEYSVPELPERSEEVRR